MNAIEIHTHKWLPSAEPGQPTLLLLHGTGGNEDDLVPLARAIAPQASLLAIRGNVLEHGAPRFFRRLAEGVFDLPDLHHRTGELGDFVEAAAGKYGFDTTTLLALGYSNGANIAASLLLSRPGALAGGLLFRAMVPFEPKEMPDLAGKRALLSAGASDPLIPRAGTQRLADIFGAAGAEVQLEWQAASHGLVPGDVKAAQAFLARA